MPLIVKDPRGVLTRAPERVREQLTSSVDVAPLLLTIASGSDDWRREPHYAHLADRLDLAGILADPAAPGRPYVLHATDETVTEFAIEPYAADAPLHVIALRTPEAKYATYSNWPAEGIDPLSSGQESELYDYRTHSGRLELHNAAGQLSPGGIAARDLRTARTTRSCAVRSPRTWAPPTAAACRLLRDRHPRREARGGHPPTTLRRSKLGRPPGRPQGLIVCEVPSTAPVGSSACTAR